MKKIIFTAVAVQTIDGKIARHAKHNVNWSSREDKTFLHRQIKASDVIIVGHNTFEVAKKALAKKEFTTRNYLVFTRSVATTKRLNPQTLLINPNRVDIKKFVTQAGYTKVCILGGTQIYGLMLKQNLIDDFFVTIEPLVFGIGQPLFDLPIKNIKFDLISIKKLNKTGTILLHYRRPLYSK